MSTLLQINYMLFQDVNGLAGHNAFLDALMAFCADILIFFWPVLLLMMWGIPSGWRKQSVSAEEAEIIHERRASVLWVGVACIVAYILNLLIEQFVYEPRPFVSHKVHLLVSHAADSSFPSDHTAWSFAVAGMFLFTVLPMAMSISRKHMQSLAASKYLRVAFWLTVVAILMACLIGFARVFVGVHYPGDILGGAIDGLLAAAIVTFVRHWLRRVTDIVLSFAHNLHLA